MKAMKLSVVMVLVAMGALAADKVQSVEAIGEAAIVKGDEVKAREDARKAALRNAVEQVAGTIISADTLTKNSQLVSDRVLSNASGYVQSFTSPQYTKDGDLVTCKLTAKVSTAPLDRDLQAVQSLVRTLDGKKMIVLLQEQVIDPKGVITQSGVMTDILSKALREDGWNLIDPAFANGKLKLAAGVSMGAAEAKEIGNLTRADYILYGQASYRQQVIADPNTASMLKGSAVFPVTGEYSITVFATDSGTQLGTIADKIVYDIKDPKMADKVSWLISYERTTYDLVRYAQAGILGKVRALIYESLRSSNQNGNKLAVDVLGLPDYGAAEDFKRVLEERRGVQSVDVNFADGKANYTVVFVGSSGDLATQFRQATFQKRKVSVTAKSNNRVELTVAK